MYLGPCFCVPERFTDNIQGFSRPRKPNPLIVKAPRGYSVGLKCYLRYRLWDSNPHSFELDFESSASTNSAKSA